ncbi:hypothetical protein HMPREF1316_1631 [Olsenella profusa F0195]|uniref:Uncharacterized protein n=1 Tax=Olsenella profusa F0195 TaxID=1125712 RepID=U2TSY9_9ACTN|nr:hypothetical protein HMPREF1316_1631 [Olsenella profusa F0195]
MRIRESYRDELEAPSFEVMENSITVILPVIGSQAAHTALLSSSPLSAAL